MAALHIPGVSIAVIHEGKLEWARGFGVTQIGGPAVTPHTLFEAGSISKPVAAMAVLHLVQAGTLDLDADANQYLKSWKIPANPFTAHHPVTLRELLTHTAGMTVHGFPGYVPGTPVPTLTQVLDGLPPANTPAIRVDMAPGTSWRYSGGGYVILQQLLEDTTGKPFYQLMHDMVLAPIGMDDSTYEQPLPASRVASAAMPYLASGRPVAGGPHVYPERAAAGLWTTPSDLARYAIELQRALAGQSRQVLATATARQMVTAGMGQWGLGIQVGGSASHPYFEHGGDDAGYHDDLVAYNTGDGAVIMTNGDNGPRLWPEILATIAHEYGWPDFQPPLRRLASVEPQKFDALTGTYRLLPGLTITFTREGSRFLSQVAGQGQVETFPAGELEYFQKVVDARVTFQLDSAGRASSIVFHQGGRDFPGSRLDDAQAKAIGEALAAGNKRFQEQRPAPGSEESLRKLIAEVLEGEPDYTRMSPNLAELTRQQLPILQKILVGFGELSSVQFKEVAPGGAAVYHLTWKQADNDWTIGFASDGKIETVNLISE